MKIKLDENIPAELIPVLESLADDVDSVKSEGLAGRDDATVWDAAKSNERFLITQDLDFSDARRFLPGTHPGVLLVRLRDPSRRSLIRCVSAVFESPTAKNLPGAFVVATEHKVRIRRAPVP